MVGTSARIRPEGRILANMEGFGYTVSVSSSLENQIPV